MRYLPYEGRRCRGGARIGGCYINNLKPWEHTLAELRAAGTLANGEQLPSLADFIDVVLEAGTTRLWLDVKNITIDGKSTEEGREASARACERACEIIEEMGAQNFCEFIVTGNATKISSSSLSPSGSVRSPRRAPWAAMPGG